MNDLIIRNLKENPEHIKILAKWHHDEWIYLNPNQTLQERQHKMQAYLNKSFIPSTWFVEADNELLGSAAIIESDMETRPELTPWLASVFVRPDYRKQGVGSALVRHVVEQAREQNYKTLYLFTPDQEALYAELGWKTFDMENYRGCKVTIMKYDLE